MSWRAQPSANGAAAWFSSETGDDTEVQFFAKVMHDHGLRTKVQKQRCHYYWSFTIYVLGSAEEVLRGRELRRGLKVAMTLRGDVYDFCCGLRAGLVEAERRGIIRTEEPHGSRRHVSDHNAFTDCVPTRQSDRSTRTVEMQKRLPLRVPARSR